MKNTLIGIGGIVVGGLIMTSVSTTTADTFTKVDNDTLRVTKQVTQDVSIEDLKNKRNDLVDQIESLTSICESNVAGLNASLSEIDSLLNEAAKVGIKKIIAE